MNSRTSRTANAMGTRSLDGQMRYLDVDRAVADGPGAEEVPVGEPCEDCDDSENGQRSQGLDDPQATAPESLEDDLHPHVAPEALRVRNGDECEHRHHEFDDVDVPGDRKVDELAPEHLEHPNKHHREDDESGEQVERAFELEEALVGRAEPAGER